MLTGDRGALARLDRAVRGRVLRDAVVRVKVWAPDGRILYSDGPRLIGRRYRAERRGARVAARRAGSTPRSATWEAREPLRAHTASCSRSTCRSTRPAAAAPVRGLPALRAVTATAGAGSRWPRRSSARWCSSSSSSSRWRAVAGAPAAARPARAEALLAQRARRVRRGAAPDRERPARRRGAGPRRAFVRPRGRRRRGRRAERAAALAAAPRRSAARPRAAHPAGRHLPAEPERAGLEAALRTWSARGGRGIDARVEIRPTSG